MTKASFFEAGALRTGSVEFDGQIWAIREASAAVVDKAMKISQDKGMLSYFAFIACHCVLDENGNRMFADNDLERLESLRIDILRAVGEAVSNLTALSSEDAEKN